MVLLARDHRAVGEENDEREKDNRPPAVNERRPRLRGVETQSGIWNLCNMKANLGARPGDSGGTVFRAIGAPSYATRIPVGTVWGRDGLTQGTFISSHGYVDYALGRRYVFNW